MDRRRGFDAPQEVLPALRLGGLQAALGFYAPVPRSRPSWLRGRQTDRLIDSKSGKTPCPDNGGYGTIEAGGSKKRLTPVRDCIVSLDAEQAWR